MRTLLLFLLLAVWGGHAYAQVSRVEYFFDTDPGAGKGIPLSVQPGNQTGGNFQLPMGNLSNGFHTLFIRAANTEGLWSHTSSAQFFLQETSVPQINATEYFLDTDPGEGKGTSVNVSSSPTGSAFFVPLTNVSGGMHTLFIRTRDNNGRWSHVNSQTFYVQPHPGSSAPAIEYFIDNDPGPGKAALMNVPTNGSLNTIIPLANTPVGFHTLGIRVKDDQGRWGHTQLSAFFVHERNDAQIDRIEYYFQNTSDTSATYTYKVPQPSASVSLDFSADLSGLQGESEYTMFLYAVTNTGVKSLVHSKQVKVCGGAVAEAKFGYIAMGTEISFIDSSRGATKYYWDFGDGSIDSVSNPVYKYAEGGNYTVKLVVENFCNKDTVERKVIASKFSEVWPKEVGNQGRITIVINGSGFEKNANLYIESGGKTGKALQTLVADDGKSAVATFDVNNFVNGSYNLRLEGSSNSTSLNNSLQLIDAVKGLVDVELEGRPNIRTGTKQTYSIAYHNKGNVDAELVPIWIAFPKQTKLTFKVPILNPKKLPGETEDINFDEVPLEAPIDSLQGKPYDGNLTGILVQRIPAGSEGTIEIEVETSSSTPQDIVIWSSPPINQSPSGFSIGDCFNTIADYFVEEGIKKGLGYLTGQSCRISFYDTFKSLHEVFKDEYNISVGRDPQWARIGSNSSLLRNIYKSIRTCAGAAASKTPVGLILNIITDVILDEDVRNNCFTFGAPALGPYKPKYLRLIPVASFDPNEKTGPSGSTAQHYTQGNAPFNYTIFFENVDTATAPAQEVIIVDTLDKSKFDLSSFQVTSYGFADSSYKAPPGLNAYAGQTLFRRATKPDMHVRFDARLDTSSGVITWRFLSIDPLTRELTDDPLDGFLAPNKKKGEGEGFVSFSIKLKPGFSTGTAIRNKALIYFDNNKPIVTNEYLNTIDVTAPQSRVNTLPAQTPDTSFTVKWSGSDAHAGIRGYDVYVAVNNGPFKLWHFDIAATEAVFTGQKDSTYRFYSIAKDYAGNTEAGKTGAEATVKIVPNAITPVDDINNPGLVFQVRPNPVAANTFVFLKLPQAEDVSITLLDAHGRVVELVTKGMKAAGEHQLPLKHDALQRGIYLVKLQSRTYQKTIRIMK